MHRTAFEVEREAVAARLRIEGDLGYWDGKRGHRDFFYHEPTRDRQAQTISLTNDFVL